MTDCPGGTVQKFLYMAKQVDFSTEGTTFRAVGKVQDVTDTINQENVEARGVGLIDVHQNRPGLRTSNVSATIDYQHGRIFEFIVGSATHTNSSTDYQHAYSLSTVPAYATIVQGNDNATIAGSKHTGQLIETAEVSYELNGNVQVSFSTQGKYADGITVKPSGTLESTLPVRYYREASVVINSVAVTKVQNANVTITNTLETVGGSESADVQCMVLIQREVTFSVNAALNTNVYRNHLKNQDITAFKFSVDNGVAYGSGKVGFDIELNSIVVTTFEESGGVGSLTLFTLSGNGKLSAVTSWDNISSANWW
jgi:hypothetical protein